MRNIEIGEPPAISLFGAGNSKVPQSLREKQVFIFSSLREGVHGVSAIVQQPGSRRNENLPVRDGGLFGYA